MSILSKKSTTITSGMLGRLYAEDQARLKEYRDMKKWEDEWTMKPKTAPFRCAGLINGADT